MCRYCFNKNIKEASSFTKEVNEAFARRFGIDLEDAENEELRLAQEDCIKVLEDYEITDENGNIIWDLKPFSFLNEKKVADTVQPSLWLNGKANLKAGVFEVVPGKIYQVRGLDIANITFVRSETGWIVIDVTTSVESARTGVKLLEEAIGENVHDAIRGVIISHSHVDHFGGIRGVVKDGENIPIFVPAGFDEETIKENVYAGTAMFHRSKYQFGSDLDPGATGRVSDGLGIAMCVGTVSYIRPTNYITEDCTIVIDGLTVEFQLTPGTEAPAEMNNYFPEYRAFWVAENCTGTLHNLYPIRGAQLRDSANWWRFTEIALERYGKEADVVFQSHNWHHRNTKEKPHAVEEFLRNNAAVYKFIHDQTLLYANMGQTPKEIAKSIRLPEALEKVWYTRPYYGSVEVNARAVYCKYLGFYNGNPIELDPLTEVEEAKQFVEYVGSEERVLELAVKDFEKGNYKQAAKAANYVVYANPSNEQARYLCADAFEQLGYQSESSIWRNAYLTGAKELREKNQDLSAQKESQGKQDMIANMTTQMILDYLGIVVDGNQLEEEDVRLRLQIVKPAEKESPSTVSYLGNVADVTEEYLVHIYHGTLLYYKGTVSDELPYVRLPERALLAIVGKQLDTVKAYIDTNCMDILEKLNDVAIDLAKHSQFSMVEP